MKKTLKKGISHRLVHLWLMVIILVFSAVIIVAMVHLTETFLDIRDASRQKTELKNAALELMNASDYLTEQVQRFTIDGDRQFLDRYFTEAFESKRREEAVTKLSAGEETTEALKYLQSAMNSSLELMNTEYYAMRLVIEARGYTDYPEILGEVTLTESDEALSPSEKMRRATELVHGDDYYELKDKIRSGMKDSIGEIDKLTDSIEESELDTLTHQIGIVHIAILIQALLVLYLLWLTTRLVINPVLNAVGQIKDNQPITEVGSREFRYLAGAYNKMYEKNRSNIESLSYKASHDELTGTYNRAGYDFLLSNLDLAATYMLLFDVDDFKKFNDTYGHETGDKVLIKLVNVLKRVFRDDDCICRIGGDEFVVFMMHSGGLNHRLIESKIELIKTELEKTDDGLPAVHVSIGVMNGSKASDADDLFKKADEAMYESKKQGKSTYTFNS